MILESFISLVFYFSLFFCILIVAVLRFLPAAHPSLCVCARAVGVVWAGKTNCRHPERDFLSPHQLSSFPPFPPPPRSSPAALRPRVVQLFSVKSPVPKSAFWNRVTHLRTPSFFPSPLWFPDGGRGPQRGEASTDCAVRSRHVLLTSCTSFFFFFHSR